MNKFSRCLRVASLATSFCLAFSGTPAFSAAPEAVSGNVALPTSLTSLVSEPFSISKKLGRIESFHWGSGKTIFHIQAAHGHYEAQTKIAEILKELEEKHGVKTVLVEGAWEPLYPEVLNFFPENPKKTQKLNDFLMRRAVVQGSELYLLNSKNAQGFGIEDEKAYLQNASDFSDVVKAREASGKFILTAVDGIEKIASAYLSRELRDFLRLEERFRNGQFAFDDWLAELKRQVQVNYGEDLSDLAFEKEWPNLVRFYQIQKNEKVMDEARFNSEKKAILGELQKVVSLRSSVDSLEQVLNFKSLESGLSPKVLMNLLNGLPNDFNFEKYPQVKAFLTTLIFQTEMDVKLLTQEIERLTSLIAEKMTNSKDEKQIVDVYQRKILLSKLLALELTPSDYEAITDRPTTNDQRPTVRHGGQGENTGLSALSAEQFKPSVLLDEIQKLNSENRVRGIAFEHTIELDAVYEKALRFYAGAKERDQHMINNIELAMAALNTDKVAVITGGFHAEPFRDYFEGKGYSYGLIMPAISQIDEEGRQTYLQGMMDQSDFLAKSATIERTPATAPSGWRLLFQTLFSMGQTEAAAVVEKRLDSSFSRELVISRRGWLGSTAGATAATALSPLIAFAEAVPDAWPVYVQTEADRKIAALKILWNPKRTIADPSEDLQARLKALEVTASSPYLVGLYAQLAANTMAVGIQVEPEIRKKALELLKFWLVDKYTLPQSYDGEQIRALLERAKTYLQAVPATDALSVDIQIIRATLEKHIDALIPRELKPGDEVVNKSTGEKVIFTGTVDGELLKVFINGGEQGEAEKLRADPQSEFFKKDIDAIRSALSLRALNQILYVDPQTKEVVSANGVQYFSEFFKLLTARMRPIEIKNEKEFDDRRKLVARTLVSVLNQYQFSVSAVNFFSSFLFSSGGEHVFNNSQLQMHALAVASEFVEQSPESQRQKYGQRLAVYDEMIRKFIKGDLTDILQMPARDDVVVALKSRYLSRWNHVLNSADLVSPVFFGQIPSDKVEAESIQRFESIVLTTKLKRDAEEYAWKILKDRAFLAKVAQEKNLQKFNQLKHLLSIIAGDSKDLVALERRLVGMKAYAQSAYLPPDIKVFAQDMVGRLSSRIAILASARSEMRALRVLLPLFGAGEASVSQRSLIVSQSGIIPQNSALRPNQIAAAKASGQVILEPTQIKLIANSPDALDAMITYFAEASKLAGRPMLPIMTEVDEMAEVINLVQGALDRLGLSQKAEEVVTIISTITQITETADTVGYISLAKLGANSVYQLDVALGNISLADQAWALAGLAIKLHSEGLAYQAANASEFEKLSSDIMQRLGIKLEGRGSSWATTLGSDWIQNLLAHSIISKSA